MYMAIFLRRGLPQFGFMQLTFPCGNHRKQQRQHDYSTFDVCMAMCGYVCMALYVWLCIYGYVCMPVYMQSLCSHLDLKFFW